MEELDSKQEKMRNFKGYVNSKKQILKMKNTRSEINNSIDRLYSRHDTKMERISELKHKEKVEN